MKTQDKKQVLRYQTRRLIDNAAGKMKQDLDKVLNSGCIDIDSYNGDFYLPKIILAALARTASDSYAPVTKEGREELENISKFI